MQWGLRDNAYKNLIVALEIIPQYETVESADAAFSD